VIQYRLGPFGWFTHPALNPTGTPEERSGNFGVLDQIKVLQWVRQNIASFGGDPGNVMIARESAGGFNVLNLLTSSLARGLFHKALVESAGGLNVPVATGISEANARIEKLLIADGTCPDSAQAAVYRASMSNSQIETYLRSKSGEELLRVMMDNPRHDLDKVIPFIDGVVLPGTLESVFASGNYSHVPIIIGCNEYELKPFLPYLCGDVPTFSGYTWSNVYNAIGLVQPPLTLDQLLPPDSYDRTLYENCGKYPSLYWKASRVDGIARLMKGHGDSVYCYMYKWSCGTGSAFDFLIGAGHGFEIALFFGYPTDMWNLGLYTPENAPGRTALFLAKRAYITSFINTGDPNRTASGFPVWEAWLNETDGPKYITLDNDPNQAKLVMMNQEVRKDEVLAQIDALPALAQELITRLIWF
jgi:para-nitrobenzyl esterase